MATTVRCDEGHGRLPHLGHLRCTACGRIHRGRPAEGCDGLVERVDGGGRHYVPCGGMEFENACAKCFEGQRRADAQASAPMKGVSGEDTYDEGSAGIQFV